MINNSEELLRLAPVEIRPYVFTRLVQEGGDVNYVGYEGTTPLMSAAAYNPNPEVVKILLKLGANVNAMDYEGSTALMYALQYQFHQPVEVIKHLINYGADIDAPNDFDKYPIIEALRTDTEVLKLLIENHANLEVRDNLGYTPLMIVLKDNLGIDKVKLLIKAGANLNVGNYSNVSLLEIAFTNFIDIEVIKLLLSYGLKKDYKNSNDETLLDFAAKNYKNVNAVKQLQELGFKAEPKKIDIFKIAKTAFHSIDSFYNSIIEAKSKGININSIDANGQTPLMIATVYNPNPKALEVLIRLGADVNAKNNDYLGGNTALILALENYNSHTPANTLEKIKILIKNGADINLCNNAKDYPLIIAIRKNITEVVRLLINNKVKTAIQDNMYGLTPLQFAIKHKCKKLIIDLLAQGQNTSKETNAVQAAIDTLTLTETVSKEVSELKNKVISFEEQLLYAAAKDEKNLEVYTDLIKQGADVNFQNDYGNTPLLYLLKNPNVNINLINLLVNNGADVNMQNNKGYTPLLIALKSDVNIEIIKLLINAGAEININKEINADNIHLVPLAVAIISNNLDIIKLLLENNVNLFEYTDSYGCKVFPSRIAIESNCKNEIIQILRDAETKKSQKKFSVSLLEKFDDLISNETNANILLKTLADIKNNLDTQDNTMWILNVLDSVERLLFTYDKLGKSITEKTALLLKYAVELMQNAENVIEDDITDLINSLVSAKQNLINSSKVSKPAESPEVKETSKFTPFFNNKKLADVANFSVPTSKRDFTFEELDAIDDPAVQEIFIEELKGILEEMEITLPAWKKNISNNELLDLGVRRAFHSIKGSGRMVGFEVLAECAWQHERLLNGIRDDLFVVNIAMTYLVEDTINLIRILLIDDKLYEEKGILLTQAEICEKFREYIAKNVSNSEAESYLAKLYTQYYGDVNAEVKATAKIAEEKPVEPSKTELENIIEKLGATDVNSALLLAFKNKDNYTEAQLNNIKILIEAGADVNVANSGGWTPLHFAVRYNNFRFVQILIEILKADVNATTKDDSSILYVAIRYNSNLDIIKLLTNNSAKLSTPRYARYEADLTAAQLAIKYKVSVGTIKYLIDREFDLNNPHKDAETFINLAEETNDPEIIRLVKAIYKLPPKQEEITAEPKAKEPPKQPKQESPLFEAVETNNNAEVENIIQSFESQKSLKLASGFNINTRNAKNQTALMVACSNPNIDVRIIKTLLKYKAKVNLIDNKGNTALHYAVINNLDNVVIKSLIDANARIDIPNVESNTAFALVSPQDPCYWLFTDYYEKKNDEVDEIEEEEDDELVYYDKDELGDSLDLNNKLANESYHTIPNNSQQLDDVENLEQLEVKDEDINTEKQNIDANTKPEKPKPTKKLSFRKILKSWLVILTTLLIVLPLALFDDYIFDHISPGLFLCVVSILMFAADGKRFIGYLFFIMYNCYVISLIFKLFSKFYE